MHPNFYFSPLFVCLAIAMATSSKAAEPVRLQDLSLSDLQQHFQLALPGLKKTAALMAHSDSLQYIRQHKDARKETHIRFQQYYAGFPVFGGYAIVHKPDPVKTLSASPTDVTMDGTVYEGLSSELGQPAVDFVKNGEFVLQQFVKKYQQLNLARQQVSPVIFMDEEHKAHWAYKVSVELVHADKIPEIAAAIIDARSHEPLVQWNDMKTASTPVKGKGFGGNLKTGQYTFGVAPWPYLDISRDDATGYCFMENDDVKVVDLQKSRYLPYRKAAKAMTFACNPAGAGLFWTGYEGNGYDNVNDAYSPSNDALFAGKVVKNMYKDWFGVDVLTNKDGSPMQLVMQVHYGTGYENAFWRDDLMTMTFGDGSNRLYPLVSTGMASHEISHGFTQQHSGLVYFRQAGALNEAFSDMAVQAAEYYTTNKNSWQIGQEILKEGNQLGALRYMNTPEIDGKSVNSVKQYEELEITGKVRNKSFEVDPHYSSGIFNRFFYLLATSPGWNTRKAFAVMVRANTDYWTPYTSFEDAGCGMLSAAVASGYKTLNIMRSLTRVGIDYTYCKNKG